MELNSDSFEIRNYELTPEGYLKFWLVGGVPNKVLEYENGRKEVINKDSLFDQKSINSAVGKPICLNHPPTAINSTNYRNLSHGITLQEYTEDAETGALVLAGIVHDSDVVEGVLKGNYKHVSASYAANKKPNDDGVLLQSEREYNHFAILSPEYAPRAGNDSKILVISDKAEKQQNQQSTNTDVADVDNTKSDVHNSSVNPSDNVSTNINTDSNKDKMKEEIAERVELLTTWKSTLEANNLAIDYNMDAMQIKKTILSLHYPEKTMKMVKESNIDGFWLGFLTTNNDSIDAGGNSHTPASEYRKPVPQTVNNFDSIVESEKQKYINKVAGKK